MNDKRKETLDKILSELDSALADVEIPKSIAEQFINMPHSELITRLYLETTHYIQSKKGAIWVAAIIKQIQANNAENNTHNY